MDLESDVAELRQLESFARMSERSLLLRLKPPHAGPAAYLKVRAACSFAYSRNFARIASSSCQKLTQGPVTRISVGFIAVYKALWGFIGEEYT